MPDTSTVTPSGIAVGSASMLSWWVTCSSTPPSFTPGASSAPSTWTATWVWIFSSRRTSSRSMWISSPRTGWCCWSLTITGRVLPATCRSINAEPSTSTWRRTRELTLNEVHSPSLPPYTTPGETLPAQPANRAGAALGTLVGGRVGRPEDAMTAGQCSGRLLAPAGPVPADTRPILVGVARKDESSIRRAGSGARLRSAPSSVRRAPATRARAANIARSAEDASGALERRHLEAAEQMVATLGRMKGAAMKIGQLASFIDTEFLPPSTASSTSRSWRRSAPPRRRCPGRRSDRCSTRSG